MQEPNKITGFSPAVGLAVFTAARLSQSSPEEWCARLGVEHAQVFDPAHRFSHEIINQCWKTLGDIFEDFGFEVAQLIGTRQQSLVEYAISNSANGKEALSTYLRYQKLIHDGAAHSFEQSASRVIVRFGAKPPLRFPGALYDFLAATTVLKTRAWLRERVELVQVILPRRRPSLLAEKIFGLAPTLGGATAEVHWPPRVLSSLLVGADESLNFLLSRQLDAVLGSSKPPAEMKPLGIEEDILAALRRELRTTLIRGDVSIGLLAKRLRTSPRSLQRVLSERGTSFRSVLDEARRAVAISLLAERGTSLAEAAFSTGFAQLPAFIRAFRRWTGTTPADYLRGASKLSQDAI